MPLPPPQPDQRPVPDAPGAPGAPPPATQRRLREAVLAHKLAAPRGRLEPVLRAGVPGSPETERSCSFRPLPGDPLDHDTRVEVAVALGNRALLLVTEPLLWLARSGELEPTSCDLEWQAAGCAAWRQLGLPPSFVVLTRHGWRHHPSAAERTWRRLRQRS